MTMRSEQSLHKNKAEEQSQDAGKSKTRREPPSLQGPTHIMDWVRAYKEQNGGKDIAKPTSTPITGSNG